MDINKEDFNGVYATIFECVGEDVVQETLLVDHKFH